MLSIGLRATNVFCEILQCSRVSLTTTIMYNLEPELHSDNTHRTTDAISHQTRHQMLFD